MDRGVCVFGLAIECGWGRVMRATESAGSTDTGTGKGTAGPIIGAMCARPIVGSA